jgi:hypothetical protein
MLAIAWLDPAMYRSLADLAPDEYLPLVAGAMRTDRALSIAVAGLSLAAALLRTRDHRFARGATALASFAYLIVPPILGLVPLGYWYLGVRKRERPSTPETP